MYLELDEVRLYYETCGSGQPLLLIPGVVVDAALYERAAQLLCAHFRVITYDRRGNSRSVAAPGAKFDMQAQVADAAELLDALDAPHAFVFGASAGALVGLGLLQRAPERVEKLALYEPPLVSLLEEGPAWIAQMQELIARRRLNTATLRFLESIGEPDARAEAKPEEVSQREMGNLTHFLCNEFSVFMEDRPDFARCAQCRDRITVAIGDRSGELPYARAARAVAQKLGVTPVYYPGGHNSPQELPRSFAISLLGTLLL